MNEILGLAFGALRPRERAYLPDQVPSPFAGQHDALGEAALLRLLRKIFLEKASKSENSPENIVEIVGDPASQLAQGFQFPGIGFARLMASSFGFHALAHEVALVDRIDERVDLIVPPAERTGDHDAVAFVAFRHTLHLAGEQAQR